MPKTARNPAGQSRRVDAPIVENQAGLLSPETAIVSGSFESVVIDRGPSSSPVFRGWPGIARAPRDKRKAKAGGQPEQAVKRSASLEFPFLCDTLLKAIASFNADNAGSKTLTEHVLAKLPHTKAAIEELNAKLRAQTSTTPSPAAFQKYIARKATRRKKPIPE